MLPFESRITLTPPDQKSGGFDGINNNLLKSTIMKAKNIERKLIRSIYGIHGIININAGLNVDGTELVPDLINGDSYRLKDGRILFVAESDMTGMAGEDMTVIFFTIECEKVPFNTFKHLLKESDRIELEDWMNDVYEINHANAINFCM